MTIDSEVILVIAVIYLAALLRRRDFYIVVREFRIVAQNDFGKGKAVESRHVHSFDDYAAARAFFELHDRYAASPSYENRQQINYLYAVPAMTSRLAQAKNDEEKSSCCQTSCRNSFLYAYST